MKTLVVATDFSEASKNAARYGLALAHDLGFNRVVLYHSFELQPIAAQMPVYDASAIQSIDEVNKERLQLLRSEFSNLFEGIESVEVVTNQYPLVHGVEHLLKGSERGFVVAGITGKSRLEQMVIGNSALNLARSVHYPVLLVPNGYSYRPLKHLVYACNPARLNTPESLRAINNLARINNAKIDIVYVNTGKDKTPQTPPQHLENLFAGHQTQAHTINSANIAEGILTHARQCDAGMIVAYVRNYGFWEGMFHRSTTTALANQVRRPLLLIKDSNYIVPNDAA